MTDRIKGLDGVRAIAVLVVIAAHAHVAGFHGGGVGVDIFFVLSGFLITYLLLSERRRFGRISLVKFWLRRVLRLFPALFILVAAVDAVALASLSWRSTGPLAESISATPGVLLYFGNWLIVATSSPALGWFGPLWSLAVEEQFYLLWPLIVILVLRLQRGRRVLAAVALAGIIAATVARFFSFDGQNLYRTFGTDFRFDMLLFGVLLALLIDSGRRELVDRASRVLIWPAGAYLVVIVFVMPDFGATSGVVAQRWYYWVGLPFVGLLAAAMVGFILTHQGGLFVKILSWGPLAYTGRISYGMYLWHYPVLMAVALATRGTVNPQLWFVIGLLGTYSLAALSFRFVEQPLHRRFQRRLRSGPRWQSLSANPVIEEISPKVSGRDQRPHLDS